MTARRSESWQRLLLCVACGAAACSGDATTGEVGQAADSGAPVVDVPDAISAGDTPPPECVSNDDCAQALTAGPCEQLVCVAGTCITRPDNALVGEACDDGDPCSHDETCTEIGTCRGTAYACSAPSACQTAACDGAGGCDLSLAAGFCLIGEVCAVAGDAAPASACLLCDPSVDPLGWSPGPCACASDADCSAFDDACNRGVCDPTQKVCVAQPQLGGACDDGEACTHSDRCQADGTCTGEIYPCGVPSTCQYAKCDGLGGCEVGLLPGFCRIDSACQGEGKANPDEPCLVCSTAESQDSWTLVGCDCLEDDDCDPPANPCRASRCDSATGTCKTDPTPGVGCNDDDPCTFGDTCSAAGECHGETYSCTSSACQVRSCDGQGGCQTTLLDGFCLIGQTCYPDGTIFVADACLVCDPSASTTSWSALDCGCAGDGDCAGLDGPCHKGRCVPGEQVCVAEVQADAPCDDGDACTSGDLCTQDGVCEGAAVDCPDPAPCESVTCDGLGGCDVSPLEGFCRIGGTCYGDGAVDPASPCRSCQADTTPDAWSLGQVGAPCDDTDLCTFEDACGADGSCAGTTAGCDVPDVCTSVVCDGLGGCSQSLLPGYCKIAGACHLAQAPNPASDCQLCDPSSSTDAWSPRPDGTVCNDGDACTHTDSCDDVGSCSGVASECEASDTCSTVSCDGSGGCDRVLAPGWCRIAGECHVAGTPRADESCQACTPSSATDAWTELPGGTPCSASDPFVLDGLCSPGQGCVDLCADPPPCHVTDEWGCATGQLLPGWCFVDGACVGQGATGDVCQWCDPGLDGWAWSSTGATCDDGEACTFGDVCDATTACTGTTSDCPEDTLCVTYTCDGDGGCDMAISAGTCLIDGSCHPGGAPGPGTCQTCNPALDATGWSSTSAGCDDGNACTHGDICGPDATCDGSAYACSGSVCTDSLCDGAGGCQTSIKTGWCRIDGTCVSNGGDHPTDSCFFCDANVASAAWSARPHGTACSLGAPTGVPGSCVDGQGCVTGCVPGPACVIHDDVGCPTAGVMPGWCAIDGACYAGGALGPGACQACDPDTDQGAWTIGDADGDGTCDNDDCSPWNPDIFPGNSEICDGLDNDCDGPVDEDMPACFLVNSTADVVDAAPGDGSCRTAASLCTLRAAVMEANALGRLTRPAAIYLPAGTYPIVLNGRETDAAGDLDVLVPLVVRGAGAGATKIVGDNTSRLFEVHPLGELGLTHVEVRGGFTGPAPVRGGGILNQGEAHLAYCVLQDNEATWVGGGLANNSDAGNDTRVDIWSCDIHHNTAYQGAGLHHSTGNASAEMRVWNSSIRDNFAHDAGGGIKAFSASGVEIMELGNVTISGNTAGFNGGGLVSVHGGTVTSDLTIRHSTITANYADFRAGGLDVGVADLTLADTVIAGNATGNQSPDVYLQTVTSDSAGGNLIGDGTGASGFVPEPGDVVGTALAPVSPLLGALGDNGGPALSHEPLGASPALGLGGAAVTPGDQRGVARAASGTDSGAVERCEMSGPDTDGDGVSDGCDVCVSDRYNDADHDGLCANEDPCHTGADSLAGPEVCDGVDNDCDGATDEGYTFCFVVDTNKDAVDTLPGNGICADADGSCTLRAAVMEANAWVGSAQPLGIYAPAGKYLLTLPTPVGDTGDSDGDLNIWGRLELRGAGIERTILSGNHMSRVFKIEMGSDTLITTLTIAEGSAHLGGGVLNRGSLTLRDCVVRDNSADTGSGAERGGGIANRAGGAATSLIIDRCAIVDNVAGREGGGVDNATNNTGDLVLEVRDSLIANNQARDFGGGVTLYRLGVGIPSAAFANTTFSQNSATGLDGGGLDVYDGWGTQAVTVGLYNCTLSGNTANRGAGVAVASSAATFINTIAADNTAVLQGHDLYLDGVSTVALAGGNIIERVSNDGGAYFFSGADLHGTDVAPVDAGLGALGLYGGPTQTYALLPTSPAIDAAVQTVFAQTTDQRGFARKQDGDGDGQGESDSGAHEAAR